MDWKNLHHWLYGLVAAVIGGTANALLGSIGSAAVGQPLNWEQIGAIALSTGFLSAVTYLSKSPLPPEGSVIKFPPPPEPPDQKQL